MNLKIQLGRKLKTVFGGKKENEEILSEIEELLITADFGIDFTARIIDNLKDISVTYEEKEITGNLKKIIMKEMAFNPQPGGRLISSCDTPPSSENNLNAHLVFGVNGTGKTTTVGKIANRIVDRTVEKNFDKSEIGKIFRGSGFDLSNFVGGLLYAFVVNTELWLPLTILSSRSFSIRKST